MKKVLLVLLMLLLVGCGESKDAFGNSTLDDVTKRWDITFPFEGKQEYQRSMATFSGDGLKYYVVKYENNQIEKSIDFKDGSNKEIEEMMGDIRNQGWDEQEPLCPIPSFDEDYQWLFVEKELDDLYLVYFPQQYRLYVLDNHI